MPVYLSRVKGLKKKMVLVPLRVFSPKRFTAAALVVPSRAYVHIESKKYGLFSNKLVPMG